MEHMTADLGRVGRRLPSSDGGADRVNWMLSIWWAVGSEMAMMQVLPGPECRECLAHGML